MAATSKEKQLREQLDYKVIMTGQFKRITTNYHITTPNDEDTTNYRKDLEKLIKESSDNTITCYTDGSRTDSEARAGFLTTTNNSPHNIINYSYFKLPDFCSVFQAEVTSIREVTTTLQHDRSKTIVVWTDSLTTLQALSSKPTRSKGSFTYYVINFLEFLPLFPP